MEDSNNDNDETGTVGDFFLDDDDASQESVVDEDEEEETEAIATFSSSSSSQSGEQQQLLPEDDSDDSDVLYDEEDDEVDELPLVRHHSYLPGASHPLYTGRLRTPAATNFTTDDVTATTTATTTTDPSYSTTTTTTTTGNNNNNSKPNRFHNDDDMDHPTWMEELAVLEIHDVVLFPGATLPIRLYHRDWIEYLSHRIRQNQRQGGKPVTLGVLTIPSSSSSSLQEEEERPERRRQSWARRSLGPNRLRRLSERLIAELGQDFDLSDDDTDDEDEDDHDDTTTGNRSNNNRQRNDNGRRALVLVGFSNRDRRRRRRRLGRDTAGPPNNNNNQQQQQQQQQQDQNNNERQQQQQIDLEQQRRHRRHEERQHRLQNYIGRIGTVATVVFTHGGSDTEDHNDGGVRRGSAAAAAAPPLLVVTAVGTSRFRIVGFRSSDERNDYMRTLQQRQDRPYDDVVSTTTGSGGVKHFYVEELPDHDLEPPRLLLPPVPSTRPPLVLANNKRYEKYLHTLPLVSPLPVHVLRMVWPQKLVADIRDSMRQSPALSGIEDTLPNEGSGDHVLDPSPFSFWLAANLPLNQEEKLHILELVSTVERLKFIRSKVIEQERQNGAGAAAAGAAICCKGCSAPIAHVGQMLTVGGAEGTTGNYINEHGIVHQTLTLRSMDESSEVWYQGGPVTQDSWFPGYSWTIMACGICGHHLGWKFDLVVSTTRNHHRSSSRSGMLRTGSGGSSSSRRNATASTDHLNRPRQFFGLSSSNVTTFVPVSTSRRDD